MKRASVCVLLSAVAIAACEQPMQPELPIAGTPTAGPAAAFDGPSFSFAPELAPCPTTYSPDFAMAPSFSLSGSSISSYAPIDLDGGNPSIAYGVNDAETVAGFVRVGGRRQAALKRKGDAGWTPLLALPAADSSLAVGINDREQVVGVRFLGGVRHPFLWADGVAHDLPMPAGYESGQAYAINDFGQVVGYLQGPAGTRAFLWTPATPNATSGATVILGEAEGSYTIAYGINDRGEVVGELGGAGDAFLWTPSSPNAASGSFESIGRPAGFTVALARDLNQRGELVGYGLQGGQIRAFYWERSEGFVLIGTLPHGTQSIAYAINENGLVAGDANAGTAGSPGSIGPDAFVWSSAERVITPLAKLAGACGGRGYAINDCGVVGGASVYPGSPAGSRATQWGVCEAPPGPELRIRKRAGRDQVNPWHKIRFVIEVENRGPGAATNVVMTDTLPAGPGIRWHQFPRDERCTLVMRDGRQVLDCRFGTLQAGESARVHVKSFTLVRSCGTYSNTAFAWADNHPRISDDATTSVRCLNLPPPDLRIGKRADAAKVKAGSPVGFTIQVANFGLTTAEEVVVTDTLVTRPGMRWQVVSGNGCSIRDGVLTCELGNLTPFTSRSITLRSATTRHSCGVIPNRAWAEAENHDVVSDGASSQVSCATYSKPKFWKSHPHHWRGYAGWMPFNWVFGKAVFAQHVTIGGLLNSGATDATTRFGQEAVAALLNSAHPRVDFPLAPWEVINLVRRAGTWGSPSIHQVTNQLERLNSAAEFPD